MKIFSSAKINLNLIVNTEVIQGLHTLSSLMIPISLFDEIKIREIDDDKDIIEFNSDVPINENSTIHKSLEYLREENDFHQRFHIVVHKNIPIEAGLGGGSSDAGSIIKFLSTKYNLLTPNRIKIANSIGSDVPFFIDGLASNVSGFGETLHPVNIPEPMHLLIVTPYENLSTARVFQEFDNQTENHHIEISLHNGIELKNNLWKSAISLEPMLLDHKNYLESVTNKEFFMSGSGTTLFCIGDEEDLISQKQNIDSQSFRLITLTKKIHSSLLQEED